MDGRESSAGAFSAMLVETGMSLRRLQLSQYRQSSFRTLRGGRYTVV